MRMSMRNRETHALMVLQPRPLHARYVYAWASEE